MDNGERDRVSDTVHAGKSSPHNHILKMEVERAVGAKLYILEMKLFIFIRSELTYLY